jgi:alpha-glucosidase (family GH31 glycosyl hydrolase)
MKLCYKHYFLFFVRYGDIDYFQNQLDFTWDPVDFAGLPEYVDWLHDNGMKFITILDPAIDSEEKDYPPYIEGQEADIWIKWPEHQNLQFNETGDRKMLGRVWPIGKSTLCAFCFALLHII